ncbi:methyltransferase domain-containing protein [Streptomyces sp. ISL-11]|uniref:protein-L-isoaspartate O-methyltransferase family protein n=1 Tax=Streptomyces sp. ISL-11 TaxID=2819174 RepID=UPI0027E42B31|nr:methyltransferase domain-containing protein [Streptomyces sp. ISL-11]
MRSPVVTQVDDGKVPAGGTGTVPTSSISAPDAVFTMLAEADLHPGQHVLEVGSGTSCNAALIEYRVGPGNVTTVEIDPALAEAARTTLRAAGYGTAVITADGEQGHPAAAPYDRLLSTASVLRVPRAWVAQTRPAGWAGDFRLRPDRHGEWFHGVARNGEGDRTLTPRRGPRAARRGFAQAGSLRWRGDQ